MNNTSPEAQQAIDQLRRSFVDSCAPVMEQFQLDQQVLRAEAAVKQQYCMMHSLSPDEVTVSSVEDEHGIRTFIAFRASQCIIDTHKCGAKCIIRLITATKCHSRTATIRIFDSRT